MALPEYMNVTQTLAWMCWRKERAVRAVADGGEAAADRWDAVLRGEYPPGLGKPKHMDPAKALDELNRMIRGGKLRRSAN